MTLSSSSALLVAAASLLIGCASATSSTRPRPTVDARAVDTLLADYDKPDGPGASVVVIQDGQVALQRAYGLADVGAHTRATPESNFRLASLTKQFTAMAILLLVEEGRLRLDDRAVDVLPGFPASLREIRIHHLLQHTSGIWDYEDFVPADSPVQVKDRDVLALVARANRAYFPPGTAVRYSNSAYAVLALIVEQVGGMPFARFLRERIFVPSGMRSTVAYEAGSSTVPLRAYGYAPDAGGFIPRDQSPTSAVLGDGGIYTSVADLAAWDRALDGHALIKAATQRLAWTPPTMPDGTASTYGFGWFVDQDGGRPRLSHHGETCGFTNAIVKYPDQHLTVIVLTNRAGGEPWRIAQQVADLWLPARTADSGPASVTARAWPFERMPNAH